MIQVKLFKTLRALYLKTEKSRLTLLTKINTPAGD